MGNGCGMTTLNICTQSVLSDNSFRNVMKCTLLGHVKTIVVCISFRQFTVVQGFLWDQNVVKINQIKLPIKYTLSLAGVENIISSTFIYTGLVHSYVVSACVFRYHSYLSTPYYLRVNQTMRTISYTSVVGVKLSKKYCAFLN